jgi:hypothetical protein
MDVPSRELTAKDRELIEFARAIVDAHTDGEFGVHTMGAAVRGVRLGVRLGAVWTPEEGTQDFDPSLFSDG